MPYKDPEAQRKYQREWVAARRTEYFQDKFCETCSTVENLELDHVDPETKVDNRIWSWSAARREIELAKCVVLCHDCHVAKSQANGDLARNRLTGERSPAAKVTQAQVEQIRELYATGRYTYLQLAEMFHLGRSTVGHIVTRYNWK